MRVIARLRDQVRNVVDCDDAVEEHHHDEDENAQCEIVQERIVHGPVVLRGRVRFKTRWRQPYPTRHPPLTSTQPDAQSTRTKSEPPCISARELHPLTWIVWRLSHRAAAGGGRSLTGAPCRGKAPALRTG